MLKYNEGIYQGKIDQLTEYISMLNGHIEKLTTYKDQLKGQPCACTFRKSLPCGGWAMQTKIGVLAGYLYFRIMGI